MSKYTTQVRFICETYAGLTESVGYGKVDEIIASARKKIFDFPYPIFDETYRNVLETKILKHFYTREIGAETVGLWKLWLNTKMNEIMPYYNKLYKSELLDFNPLYDVDLTREHKITKEGTKTDSGETTGNTTSNVNSSDTANTTNNNSNYYSDTPQGGVGNLENLSYLTNATLDRGTVETSNTGVTNANSNSSSTSSLDSVISNTEDYLESVKGKNGGTTYSKMLEEYRTTFLNIDMQVINELNDLFMNLW